MRKDRYNLWTLILLLCCCWGASAGAQQGNAARELGLPFSKVRTSTFGQEVPPFLREAPAPTTAIIDGVVRPIPKFAGGINPKVHSPLMIERPRLNFLQGYAEATGLNLFLTYPYLENYNDTPNRLSVLSGLRGPSARFDYQQTLPHLAFFCRMEINKARGNIIPAKFRLGGHRHWQDNLLRQ